ncbi:MAG: dihydropteroate synthase, partial [Cognaticolwellia sp.]
SFSDGGRYAGAGQSLQARVDRACRLVEEGASWVDLGGESTRPGAEPVSVAEELDRVIPVLQAIVAQGIQVSVDTRKAQVARAALAAGAQVINDVGGFEDPEMVDAVASAGAGAVVMHMRGVPQNMQADTQYGDVLVEVRGMLLTRINRLRQAGVGQIWADPGIGFGKSPQQCAELIARLSELQDLGVPLYVGASRKSFIPGLVGPLPTQDRLPGSLAAAGAAVLAGAQVLRVHDVAETQQFLKVFAACRGVA